MKKIYLITRTAGWVVLMIVAVPICFPILVAGSILLSKTLIEDE